MPIEKTPNYIRIRVESPSKFVRFRVKTLGKGIKAVIGFFKEGGSKIQSLLFPRSRYTLAEAKAWVKSHGYTVHETLLVYDIIINPKTFNMIFIEETVDEVQESQIPRPTRKPWQWLLDDEVEWTLYE
jgi:hypothetical protein